MDIFRRHGFDAVAEVGEIVPKQGVALVVR
jgi:hypothetical protein